MKKLSKIATIVGSLLFAMMYINTASADVNPFAQVDQVQTIVGDDGKCGDKKDKKCGEGKDKKCGEGKDKKCGEGKCGDKKGKKEGKCGDKKDKKKEGKCGEGKCGGK